MDIIYHYVLAPVLTILTFLFSEAVGIAEGFIPDFIANPLTQVGEAFIPVFDGLSESFNTLLIMIFGF